MGNFVRRNLANPASYYSSPTSSSPEARVPRGSIIIAKHHGGRNDGRDERRDRACCGRPRSCHVGRKKDQENCSQKEATGARPGRPCGRKIRTASADGHSVQHMGMPAWLSQQSILGTKLTKGHTVQQMVRRRSRGQICVADARQGTLQHCPRQRIHARRQSTRQLLLPFVCEGLVSEGPGLRISPSTARNTRCVLAECRLLWSRPPLFVPR